MKVLYWLSGILLVLTAVPAIFFFGLYLATGEDGARKRAVLFWRWAVLDVLTTFNIVLFTHVITTFLSLVRN
jgi:hypothetical protein